MILVYRAQDRAIFVYGFAKNERENIEPDELEDLGSIAADLLAADVLAITVMVANGELQEVSYDDEAQPDS